MALELKLLGPGFVAEVVGVDLRQPITAAQAADYEAAMDRYAVLVFRGQSLDELEQRRFTDWFGPADLGLRKLEPRLARPSFKLRETVSISNLTDDGATRDGDDPRLAGYLANMVWHSDSSFKSPAAKYSLLYAEEIPQRGGDTQFADERAAYDALPPEMKERIASLVAIHTFSNAREFLGLSFNQAQRDLLPAVRWPIVRTHPSGRRTLFLGSHAGDIEGMPRGLARLLLLDLQEHATQREFVYTHKWREGDLVMWDNRCVLHRGRPHDIDARRMLRRTTVEDSVEEAKRVA